MIIKWDNLLNFKLSFAFFSLLLAIFFRWSYIACRFVKWTFHKTYLVHVQHLFYLRHCGHLKCLHFICINWPSKNFIRPYRQILKVFLKRNTLNFVRQFSLLTCQQKKFIFEVIAFHHGQSYVIFPFLCNWFWHDRYIVRDTVSVDSYVC